MKPSSKKILLPFFPLFLVAVVLQAVTFRTAFESDSSYFVRGSLLPGVSTALLATALILAAVSAFLNRERQVSPAPFFTMLPAALGCFVSAGFLFTAKPIGAILLIAAGVFFVLLVLCSLVESRVLRILSPYFGFVSLAALIFLCVVYYFDMTLEMNAPVKILSHVGLLACLLYVTAEIRCLLGRGLPRLFAFLTALTAAIGLFASLPLLIAFLGGNPDRTQYPSFFAGTITILGIALSALLRLIVLWIYGSAEGDAAESTAEVAVSPDGDVLRDDPADQEAES